VISKTKGISLIEVLMVTLIIGIIAGMGVLAISHFLPSIHLSGATKELVVEIKRAQQYAVTTQIRHQVKFLQSENKYQLIKESNPETIVTEKTLPEGITFGNISFPSNFVSFNAAGVPSQSGSVELVNRLNKKAIIEINPVGFIKTRNE